MTTDNNKTGPAAKTGEIERVAAMKLLRAGLVEAHNKIIEVQVKTHTAFDNCFPVEYRTLDVAARHKTRLTSRVFDGLDAEIENKIIPALNLAIGQLDFHIQGGI